MAPIASSSLISGIIRAETHTQGDLSPVRKLLGGRLEVMDVADISQRNRHVHFTPKSRHRSRWQQCPLCAKSRHPLVPNYFGLSRLRSIISLAGCLGSSSRLA